jgi:hypothetical protein
MGDAYRSGGMRYDEESQEHHENPWEIAIDCRACNQAEMLYPAQPDAIRLQPQCNPVAIRV